MPVITRVSNVFLRLRIFLRNSLGMIPIVMNFTRPPDRINVPSAHPFWPSPVLRRRFALGVALSIAVHVLAGLSTAYGWLNLMPWFGKPEDKPAIVLSARLVTPPPPPVATPVPAKPAVPSTRKPAVRTSPRAVMAQTVNPDAAPVAASAPPTVDRTPAPSAPEPPVAREEPVPAPPPKIAKASPFPERARIEFEMTLESNNYKVWAVQTWEGHDGKYRVLLTAEAKALFFSIGKLTMESSGVINADGLRPERYVDERNQRRTIVTYAANEKSAYVEEPNGNKKTVQLAGQAADVMSLTYDLGFNTEIAIGTPFTLSNRDTVEEIRLVERRDEMLVTDNLTVATRFFDLKRPNGSGGIQVWLAMDKNWLPAKIRILGRDGAVTLTATKFEINPPAQ